jgi:hypothetical protein
MISLPHELLQNFHRAESSCSFGCDSLLLGALIKKVQTRGLFSPRPVEPFLGLSATVRAENIRSIKSPAWCSYRGANKKCRIHPCTLYSFINPVIDEMDDQMKDLALDMYLAD